MNPSGLYKVESLALSTSLGSLYGDTAYQGPSGISKPGSDWGFCGTDLFLFLCIYSF